MVCRKHPRPDKKWIHQYKQQSKEGGGAAARQPPKLNRKGYLLFKDKLTAKTEIPPWTAARKGVGNVTCALGWPSEDSKDTLHLGECKPGGSPHWLFSKDDSTAHTTPLSAWLVD